jgi:hypothetical protein
MGRWWENGEMGFQRICKRHPYDPVQGDKRGEMREKRTISHLKHLLHSLNG